MNENLKMAAELNAQHPATWIAGHWYPAIGPNNTPVEIRRTSGVGRNAGTKFLHIKKPGQFYQYQVNLLTGDTKVLQHA